MWQSIAIRTVGTDKLTSCILRLIYDRVISIERFANVRVLDCSRRQQSTVIGNYKDSQFLFRWQIESGPQNRTGITRRATWFLYQPNPLATRNSIVTGRFSFVLQWCEITGFTEIIFSAMYNTGGESCSPFLLVDHAVSLSLSLPPLSLSLVQKVVKLNVFPKADGNRARRSNPISTNLSRGKDKCVLLCSSARRFIPWKTFLIHIYRYI